jgi:hypothetical protein
MTSTEEPTPVSADENKDGHVDRTEYEQAVTLSYARFATIVNPTTKQTEDMAHLKALILELCTEIQIKVPAGRNQSLALKALEDVSMRANRGITAAEGMK